jgi:hypothetical protein
MRHAQRAKAMRHEVHLAMQVDEATRERWAHTHQQTRNAFIDWVARPRLAGRRNRRLRVLPRLLAEHDRNIAAIADGDARTPQLRSRLPLSL